MINVASIRKWTAFWVLATICASSLLALIYPWIVIPIPLSLLASLYLSILGHPLIQLSCIVGMVTYSFYNNPLWRHQKCLSIFGYWANFFCVGLVGWACLIYIWQWPASSRGEAPLLFFLGYSTAISCIGMFSDHRGLDTRFRENAIRMVILGVCLSSFWQPFVAAHYKSIARLGGIFINPNSMGAFSAVSLIFLWQESGKEKGKGHRSVFGQILELAALAVSFVTLILTFSRSAWLGAILGFACGTAHDWKKVLDESFRKPSGLASIVIYWLGSWRLWLAIGCAVAFILLFERDAVERIAMRASPTNSWSDRALSSRYYASRNTVKELISSPFVPFGWEKWTDRLVKDKVRAAETGNGYIPLNDFLTICVIVGPVLGLAFCLLFLGTIVDSYRAKGGLYLYILIVLSPSVIANRVLFAPLLAALFWYSLISIWTFGEPRESS